MFKQLVIYRFAHAHTQTQSNFYFVNIVCVKGVGDGSYVTSFRRLFIFIIYYRLLKYLDEWFANFFDVFAKLSTTKGCHHQSLLKNKIFLFNFGIVSCHALLCLKPLSVFIIGLVSCWIKMASFILRM